MLSFLALTGIWKLCPVSAELSQWTSVCTLQLVLMVSVLFIIFYRLVGNKYLISGIIDQVTYTRKSAENQWLFGGKRVKVLLNQVKE